MHKQIRKLESVTTGLTNMTKQLSVFFVGNHSLPVQMEQLRQNTIANEQWIQMVHTSNLHLQTLQAIRFSTFTFVSDLNHLSPTIVHPYLLKSILNQSKITVIIFLQSL